MQKVSAEGHIFHRSCFRCRRCNSTLQSKVYEYDEHDDRFYCRTHFNEINRQRSIKRTMHERGIKSFDDENNIPLGKKQIIDQNKSKDELTKKPSLSTDELAIKQGLPSLLANLAQQKKTNSEITVEKPLKSNGPLTKHTSESKLPPPRPKLPSTSSPKPPRPKLPPTTSGSPITSSPKIPPTTSVSKIPPTTSAPKIPPTTSVSKIPPTTSVSKIPPTTSVSKIPPTISVSKIPPRSPTISTSSPLTSHAVTKPKLTAVKSTPLNDNTPKEEAIPVRQSVGAWWKKKEEESREKNQEIKIGAKQKQQQNPLPKQQLAPKDSTDDIRATVLEHYEFGVNFLQENTKAKEVLEERYEILDNVVSPDSTQEEKEPNPYEVPVLVLPTKPPRTKRKGAKINEPHPHRDSDTWSKPYAVTDPNTIKDTPDVSPRLSWKPSRPAPPPPHKIKAARRQKGADVSPYAVSNMYNQSPIRGKPCMPT